MPSFLQEADTMNHSAGSGEPVEQTRSRIRRESLRGRARTGPVPLLSPPIPSPTRLFIRLWRIHELLETRNRVKKLRSLPQAPCLEPIFRQGKLTRSVLASTRGKVPCRATG